MQHCYTTVVSANSAFLLLWVVEWRSECQASWSLDLSKEHPLPFLPRAERMAREIAVWRTAEARGGWAVPCPMTCLGPLPTPALPVHCLLPCGYAFLLLGSPAHAVYAFSLLTMPPFVPGVTIALSWASNKEMRSTRRQWGRMLNKGGGLAMRGRREKVNQIPPS